MTTCSNLTLIMVTRNRAAFVRAYLAFLSDCGFTGTLLVADGSDYSDEENLKEHFSSCNANFSLKYLNVPKGRETSWVNMNRCIALAAKDLSTKYAALCFDDDFVIPSFCSKACTILDNDDNLGFVVGDMLLIGNSTDEKDWRFWKKVEKQIAIPLLQDDFKSRLIAYSLRPFQLCYAIVRSNTILKYSVKETEDYFMAGLSADWSWYLAILASGKGKKIGNSHVLRLRHAQHMASFSGQTFADYLRNWESGEVYLDVNRFAARISAYEKSQTSNLRESSGDLDFALSVASHTAIKYLEKITRQKLMQLSQEPSKKKSRDSRFGGSFVRRVSPSTYLQSLKSLRLLILNFRYVRPLMVSLRKSST